MRILILSLLASVVWAQNFTVIAGANGDRMDQPYGLGTGPDKALYFCEIGNHRISRLDLKTGKFATFVGTGQKGYAGDGGPATAALTDEPYEIAFNRAGDLFFCDRPVHVIRKVDHKTHIITTVAGTGKEGYAGDGGPAKQAEFRQPHSIAFAPDGHLLICDILNFRIRSLDLAKGTIETWAGTGQRGKAEDGAPLKTTPLDGPRALAIDKAGNYYLALREGNAIYRMDVKAGKLYRFAGTGEKGFTGDGADAKSARLSGPKGVALAPDGSLYIADTENHAIRKVDRNGIITTVAGDGQRGDGPRLARPHGVFVDTNGAVYIADSENNRILLLK
jgi:sugar lactone lactonase YvrE